MRRLIRAALLATRDVVGFVLIAEPRFRGH